MQLLYDRKITTPLYSFILEMKSVQTNQVNTEGFVVVVFAFLTRFLPCTEDEPQQYPIAEPMPSASLSEDACTPEHSLQSQFVSYSRSLPTSPGTT